MISLFEDVGRLTAILDQSARAAEYTDCISAIIVLDMTLNNLMVRPR